MNFELQEVLEGYFSERMMEIRLCAHVMTVFILVVRQDLSLKWN